MMGDYILGVWLANLVGVIAILGSLDDRAMAISDELRFRVLRAFLLGRVQ